MRLTILLTLVLPILSFYQPRRRSNLNRRGMKRCHKHLKENITTTYKNYVPSRGSGVGLKDRRVKLPTSRSNRNYQADLAVKGSRCTHDLKSGFVTDTDYFQTFEDPKCPPKYSKSKNDRFDTNNVDLKNNATYGDQQKYSAPGSTPPLPGNYKLIWSDEFDGNSLDLEKWQYEVNCLGGGNNEAQCYVNHSDVLKVENGLLTLQAHYNKEGYVLTPQDNCNADPDSQSRGACTNRKPIRSARIHTRADKNIKFKYGRFEMKAKIPKGNYLWPAFWMLPSDYKYGTWAASGEFDIMESRGQKPDEIGHALHYGGQWPNNVYSNLQYVQSNLADDFMVYGLDWSPTEIKFYVNDKFTYVVDTKRDWKAPGVQSSPYSNLGQPWDQDFILLLNLAVGGTFFPNNKFDPEVDTKTWSQAYIIDYVRVYQP